MGRPDVARGGSEDTVAPRLGLDHEDRAAEGFQWGVQHAIVDAEIHPAVDLVHRRVAAQALADKLVRSAAFHEALKSPRSIVAASHSF